MVLVKDHGELHDEYVANGRECACHGRIHRCDKCPFVTYSINEWARHIVNDDHLPGIEEV